MYLNDNSYISIKNEEISHPHKKFKDSAIDNKKDIYQRVCDLHKIKTELKKTLLPKEYRDYSETIFQFKKKSKLSNKIDKKLESDKMKKVVVNKFPGLKGSLESDLNPEYLDFVSPHSRNISNKLLPIAKELVRTEFKIPVKSLKGIEDQHKIELKNNSRKTSSIPKSFNDVFLKDLFSNTFLNENSNYIKQLKR
jgi:hypothetical protein